MNALTKIKNSGLTIFILLLAVNILGNFSGFLHFGIYEDDYWYVVNPVNFSTRELLSFLGDNITNIEAGQGRLIGMNLPLLIIHFLYKIGGLYALYIAGLLLISLNAYLLFGLLRKNYGTLLGIMAAIIFVVFPADTTKPFLTHIYQLQLSLLFVLIGFYFLSKKRFLLSYIIAFCSLLTYENAFLPFFFAPFLVFSRWDRKIYLQGLRHLLICGAMIIAIFVFRKFSGEERVAELTMTDFIKKTIASSLIGPATVFISFINAPLQSLVFIKETLITILLSAIVIFVSFWLFFSKYGFSAQTEAYRINLKSLKANVEIGKELHQFLQLFLVSALMLAVAYLFSYTHYPPTVLKGRMTSVHFGASIGGAVFVANLLYRLIYLLRQRKTIGFLLVSIFLSLLAGYNFHVQTDYKNAWHNQQSFWSGISKICPDASDNMLILIPRNELDSTEFIETHTWPMPGVLDEIYEFPVSWAHPPKIIPYDSWSDFQYDTHSNSFYYIPDYPFLFEDRDTVYLENNKVISLEVVNNTLERRFDTAFINNRPVILKSLGNSNIKDWDLTETGKLILKDN
jgi:hypothetical protein